MPYHNIEHAMSQAEKAEYILRLQKLREDMTFLINLTTKERLAGRKGHNKYAFVKSALDYARDKPEIIPPAFSVPGWSKDVNLHDDLMPIFGIVKVLYESMEDTLFALRLEMNKAAVDFYKIAGVASRTNVAGTTDMIADLKGKLNKKK